MCVERQKWEMRRKDKVFKTNPYQSKLCFRVVVTKIPDNSITSCGTVVVPTRPGLEDLDTESVDEGMSFGIGRLIIGKTGGGERPCGCSTRVGEG